MSKRKPSPPPRDRSKEPRQTALVPEEILTAETTVRQALEAHRESFPLSEQGPAADAIEAFDSLVGRMHRHYAGAS